MTTRIKYPRTPHLPWSLGGTSDDSLLSGTTHFQGKEIVVTEKLDGESTTMYRDGIHARSIDSKHHPSRDWVKALHGSIRQDIPQYWRVCGENVYARHSIAYDRLESYFHVFSIWNDRNEALSWDETCEWARLLGLVTVPELYRGDWDEHFVRGLTLDTATQEGYVVRIADGFAFEEFHQSIAKWVRRGHVQTNQHWMFAEVVPNRLREVDSSE